MVPWSNPNGISIGSSVFAGLTLVSNRLTDRHTHTHTHTHTQTTLHEATPLHPVRAMCGLKSNFLSVERRQTGAR